MTEQFPFNSNESIQEAPEEWTDITSLAEKFGFDKGVIERRVQKIVEESSGEIAEEIGMFKSKNGGKPAKYLSPKLTEIIEKNLPKEAPKGWIDLVSFAEEHKLSRGTIEKRVKKLLQESNGNLTEEVGEFMSKRGRVPGTYFSPEFAELIKKELPNEAPMSWVDTPTLMEKYAVGENVLKRRIQKTIEESNGELKEGEETGLFRSPGGLAIYYSPKLVKLVEKNLPKEAPEGWIDLISFLKKYKTSRSIVENRAQKIIEESNGKLAKKMGTFPAKKSGYPTTYFSPEFAELIKKELPKDAPEGWTDLSSLMERYGFGATMIVSRAQKIIEESNGKIKKDEEMGIFPSNKNGSPSMHLSPRLVELIKQQLPEKTPDGWISIIPLTEKYGIDKTIIENRAKKIIEESGGELKKDNEMGMFPSKKRNRLTMYFSPKLIELIEQRLPKEVPEGWLDLGSVTKKSRADKSTIKNRIKKIIEESNGKIKKDEEMGIYPSPKGGPPSVYLSPKLVELVEKNLPKEVPEGWISMLSFSEKDDSSRTKIEGRVKKIIEESNGELKKEDEMGVFLSKKSKRPSIYISPRLVKLIEKDLLKEAPKDWADLASLAEKYNTDNQYIQRKAKKIIEESKGELKEEDEMGIFRSKKSGMPTTCFSPKLIELIEQGLPKEAPMGWSDMVSLMEKYEVNRLTIQKRVKKIINESNGKLKEDEEIGVFPSKKSNNRLTTYFSPKLVELIEQGLPKKAPENWMDRVSLAKKYGFNPSTVKNTAEKIILESNGKLKESMDMGMFRSSGGLAIYYSPRLVELINEKFSRETLDQPPEGWTSVETLAKNTKIDAEKIRRIINKNIS